MFITWYICTIGLHKIICIQLTTVCQISNRILGIAYYNCVIFIALIAVVCEENKSGRENT